MNGLKRYLGGKSCYLLLNCVERAKEREESEVMQGGKITTREDTQVWHPF